MTGRENLRRWARPISRADALKTAAKWDSDGRRHEITRKTSARRTVARKARKGKTFASKTFEWKAPARQAFDRPTQSQGKPRRAERGHARGSAQTNRRDQSATGRAVQRSRAPG